MALSNLRNIVQSNVSNLASSVGNTARTLGSNIANRALDQIGPAGNILKGILNGPSSIPTSRSRTTAKVSGAGDDWRVKLSLPNKYAGEDIFRPLVITNGMVFPYTPTILIQHTASYDALQPVHSNYPYLQYQSSQIEDIVITGDFFCENAKDAQYWAAMLHYLRTMTKMSYGQSTDLGSPPPVVFLNGYGDFVFPNVPVIIKNFTVDLPADVDYIKTQVDGEVSISATTSLSGMYEGYAPVQSQVAVTVSPLYSRAKTSSFSLNEFVRGGYLGTGQSGGGFI